MSDFYILDDHTPVRVGDVQTWCRWFEAHDQERVVAKSDLSDEVHVSTMFLGIDHQFVTVTSRAILFETMIFGGEHDGFQERYATWDEAQAGHRRAVELVVRD